MLAEFKYFCSQVEERLKSENLSEEGKRELLVKSLSEFMIDQMNKKYTLINKK